MNRILLFILVIGSTQLTMADTLKAKSSGVEINGSLTYDGQIFQLGLKVRRS